MRLRAWGTVQVEFEVGRALVGGKLGENNVFATAAPEDRSAARGTLVAHPLGVVAGHLIVPSR